MSQPVVITFNAEDNANLALAHIGLISKARWTEDGDALYMQDYDSWVANSVVCFVAQTAEAGAVVGGAAIRKTGNTSELIAVYVDKDARGTGVAHVLMDAALDHCHKSGVSHIHLDIRLTDDGLPEAAFRLYEAHGFRLLQGVLTTPIGWSEKSRHLWRNPDPSGMFRSRVMALTLSHIATSPQQEGGRDVA